MKRLNNLYERIISMDNLRVAADIVCENTSNKKGVAVFEENRGENLKNLHEILKNGQYRTSVYKTAVIHDPKKRPLGILPVYPDKITHQAIMNVMKPIWRSSFIKDTYSNIKGRGTLKCVNSVKKALKKDPKVTEYCLLLDIRKFYFMINREILKKIVRRRIKDTRLLFLLDELIDSAGTLPETHKIYEGCGIPMGDFPSPYLSNLYLTPFDHWIKEKKRVKYYWRYADNMVILSDNKEKLHELRSEIRDYLWNNLKLRLNRSNQVFRVDDRGIDFIGYVLFHTHTLLRKKIKKSLARAVSKVNRDGISDEKEIKRRICGWIGWTRHCNSRHLIKTLKIEKLCS